MPNERYGHFYTDQTCIGCGACDHACPGKVDASYRVESDFLGRFAIIADERIDCGICVPLCPVNCIHGAGGYTRMLELQARAQQAG